MNVETAPNVPGRRPLRILFLSHTPLNPFLVVGSHHLSRALADEGHQVAHVAAPVTPAHLLRMTDPIVRTRLHRSLSPARKVGDRLVEAVPITPLPLAAVSPRLRRVMLRSPAVWRIGVSQFIDSPDVVFVDQPILGELARVAKPAKLVYRPTDAHFDPRIRAAEIDILDRADAVIATSSEALRQVLAGTDWSGPTGVLENGVDFDRFVTDRSVNRSGFIYVGAVDRRFDWPLLEYLALNLPDQMFRIVGPVSIQFGKLPPNIHVMGAVPYSEVPPLLHKSAIGLLPLSRDPANDGRSPMKYYEYLAAGLAVLSRKSPTLENRSSPAVRLYNDREAALTAAKELLSSAPSDIEAARQFGWRYRAHELLRLAGFF